MVKKSLFSLYNTRIEATGLIAINIRDEDELVAVRKVDPEEEILMTSHKGLTVRFSESDARAMGS
jgi:DNA gyrase subunit A